MSSCGPTIPLWPNMDQKYIDDNVRLWNKPSFYKNIFQKFSFVQGDYFLGNGRSVHPSHNLSCDRSIDLSKPSSPQSAI